MAEFVGGKLFVFVYAAGVALAVRLCFLNGFCLSGVIVCWCDIGCPTTLAAAVSRLMRPKTDTLVLPPPAISHPSTGPCPCVIHTHYSCSSQGENKTRKIGSFPTYRTAAVANCISQTCFPLMRVGPTSQSCMRTVFFEL